MYSECLYLGQESLINKTKNKKKHRKSVETGNLHRKFLEETGIWQDTSVISAQRGGGTRSRDSRSTNHKFCIYLTRDSVIATVILNPEKSSVYSTVILNPNRTF